MFLAAANLTTQTVAPCAPWEFTPVEPVSAQVRGNKEDRQRWYKNPSTVHCFYTGIEAANTGQRVSKDNPPRLIHAFIADYDIKIPPDRIAEAINAMEIKPAWVEVSLGGNFRLIWPLQTPIHVDNREFCTFILQQAVGWLRLGLLPGLDQKAFEETTRLYCNGCAWRATGAEAVPSLASQAFFVECGQKYRFRAGDDENVPLELVEKALKDKYPDFIWPTTFEPESQGPSFWIPGSTSPQSAILKAGGFFTFAAHADKPFYSWSDLLGKDFTKKFQADAIARATADVFWDQKKFHRKKDGRMYSPVEMNEMRSYLRVQCRLSAKPGADGISQIDRALEHIFSHQYVTGAAPFVMRPPGLLIYRGERKLNTYNGKPVAPAAGTQKWGEHGEFPFMSLLSDNLFDPAGQLAWWLAWLKHYYTSAFTWDPHPGQNIALMGGVGVGKTLVNREVIGVGVGGYVDASDFLVEGGAFNSHLLREVHWCLDDDTPAQNPQAQQRLYSLFKKMVANQQFLCNEKFISASMVEWMGRIGCTTNLDYISAKLVGPLDNSALDKMCLFRCQTISKIDFPRRDVLLSILEKERPYFFRYLLDWNPPDYIERHPRYGYVAYQEKSLLENTQQSSSAAPFKEVLIESLFNWFTQNPTVPKWEGTVSMLLKLILSDYANEMILKSLRLEQTNRYLEQIAREGSVKCEAVLGKQNTRVWRFYRESFDAKPV